MPTAAALQATSPLGSRPTIVSSTLGERAPSARWVRAVIVSSPCPFPHSRVVTRCQSARKRELKQLWIDTWIPGCAPQCGVGSDPPMTCCREGEIPYAYEIPEVLSLATLTCFDVSPFPLLRIHSHHTPHHRYLRFLSPLDDNSASIDLTCQTRSYPVTQGSAAPWTSHPPRPTSACG